MEELVIKSHDFEESKKKLKKFSEETTTDFDLNKVDSDKGVGEFFGDLLFGRGLGLDHKVTGSELNSLTNQIQYHLTSINDMQKNFINEIGHVYNALEALDKDYIKAIIISIKSAQKANREAKIAQDDIEKTVEEQKKIIKVLQKFKEKLDNFVHIEDIDRMWSEIQTFQNSIYENQISIYKLEQFKNQIDKYKHLSEIDKMWWDNQSNKKDIADIKESTKQLIVSLSKHMEDLICNLNLQADTLSSNEKILDKLNSITHIYEVDDTWQVVSDTVKKVDDIITKMEKIYSMFDEYVEFKEHVKMLNQSKVSLEKQNIDLYSKLEEEHNKLEEMESRFSRKIKISYLLSGGSIGLLVIQFIFFILGMI